VIIYDATPPGINLSKVVEGSTKVTTRGNYSYTMTVRNFAAFRQSSAPKAKGRFWEILVWFTNTGKNTAKLDFVGKGQSMMDAGLIIPDKKSLELKAFLIPSTGIAPISLITAWQGPLGLKLEPGEKTWLILVFDVPTEIKAAQLRLKQAAPLKVILEEAP
jgi:hypothetical protein